MLSTAADGSYAFVPNIRAPGYMRGVFQFAMWVLLMLYLFNLAYSFIF